MLIITDVAGSENSSRSNPYCFFLALTNSAILPCFVLYIVDGEHYIVLPLLQPIPVVL